VLDGGSVHRFQCSTKELPSLRVADWCDHQALAIGSQGEGVFALMSRRLKDPEVNHQGETISMLGQPLDHVGASHYVVSMTMYPLVTTMYHRGQKPLSSVQHADLGASLNPTDRETAVET
jgi:hypothetical protein